MALTWCSLALDLSRDFGRTTIF